MLLAPGLMDTYWLLSATANQGTCGEGDAIYTAEEGPAYMKDIADMADNFGNAAEQDELETNL